MESGSRSSVKYEVEVIDGMASLYANKEIIEVVQKVQLDELLKEYFVNPKKVYLGMLAGGAQVYEIKENDIDSEMAQVAAAVASINNSVVTQATTANHNELDIDRILNQFRSAVKDNL